MSWFSDMLEKRKRFYEKYPNGNGNDWVRFLTEEAMAKTSEGEKELIDSAAGSIVANSRG